jgi:hypothetical protein
LLTNENRKYEIFNKWCQKEGVVMPKLEYPYKFEGGLIGMRCTDDINHREAFCFIPYKMIMCVGKA